MIDEYENFNCSVYQFDMHNTKMSLSRKKKFKLFWLILHMIFHIGFQRSFGKDGKLYKSTLDHTCKSIDLYKRSVPRNSVLPRSSKSLENEA
jgi:hypothetical protein